jgi:hypothetical protein
MLPVPLLQLILRALDNENLLTESQRRAVFAWARDRSTLGLHMHLFLERITNAPPLVPEEPVLSKKASCTVM